MFRVIRNIMITVGNIITGIFEVFAREWRLNRRHKYPSVLNTMDDHLLIYKASQDNEGNWLNEGE